MGLEILDFIIILSYFILVLIVGFMLSSKARKNLDQYFKSINGINDLKSISFMRMILENFENQTTLRFATLDLVKTE